MLTEHATNIKFMECRIDTEKEAAKWYDEFLKGLES